MDRSLYLAYILLLDKHILVRIDINYTVFHIFYLYITQNAYQVVGVIVGDKRCFMLIYILLVICSSPVVYTLSLYVYIHEAFVILSCYLNCGLT